MRVLVRSKCRPPPPVFPGYMAQFRGEFRSNVLVTLATNGQTFDKPSASCPPLAWVPPPFPLSPAPPAASRLCPAVSCLCPACVLLVSRCVRCVRTFRCLSRCASETALLIRWGANRSAIAETFRRSNRFESPSLTGTMSIDFGLRPVSTSTGKLRLEARRDVIFDIAL